VTTDGHHLSAAARRHAGSRLVTPARLSIAIAALVAWLSYAVVPANVDVSYMILICDRLLGGARLHVDIIETNPPFSVWLYMPFVLAERMTGWPAELWLSLGVPALALLSVALSATILRPAGLLDGGRLAWLAPVTVAATLYVLPGNFGQREQIGVIALLPWLALLAARAATPDFRAGTAFQHIVAGIGAAVFVMIKPPFAALALALPAFSLGLARRSLRPVFTTETVLGAAITLFYLALLAVFHRPFFTDVLPMLLELYLPARKPLFHGDLLRPVAGLAVMLAIAFAAARPQRIDRSAGLLFLAAFGYVPCFLWMGKGWDYQSLPIVVFGVLGLAVQLWKLPPWREAAPIARLTMAAGLIVALGLAGAGFAQGFLQASNVTELNRARDAISSVVERPTVASIATRMQAAHPLTRLIEGRYLSRHPSLWAVDNAETMILSADDAERISRLETLRDQHVTDAALELQRIAPDVVVDGGSMPTVGQAAVHWNPSIVRILADYRIVYRDSATTVWARSDLPGSSPVSD
jgi:hypothetical protein